MISVDTLTRHVGFSGGNFFTIPTHLLAIPGLKSRIFKSKSPCLEIRRGPSIRYEL